MDAKDSFWSRAYKGGYIQGCQNRTQGREEIRVCFADGTIKPVKSYRAAQLALNAAAPVTTACQG